MFLGKRYWAERAVRKAGVPVDDPVGVELTDMLVIGATQCQEAFQAKPGGGRADDLDFTVMSARIMPSNASALRRVRDRYALPEETARHMLGLVRQAAYDLFADEGRRLPD